MIKITDKMGENAIKIPKTTSKLADFYILTLKSETNQEYVFDNLEDESVLPNYYQFKVDFSECKDGEYKYTVMGEVEDYGIIRIGDVTPQNKQNNTEDKILQYEG